MRFAIAGREYSNVLSLLAGAMALTAATAAAQGPPPRAVPDQYIVVFHKQVVDPPAAAAQLARAHGLAVQHVYGTALKGFAASVPAGRLRALQNDPRVAYIEPDRIAEVQGRIEINAKPGGGGGGGGGELIPTGVSRIYYGAQTTFNSIPDVVPVNVAVIDTGISDHPELNILGGVNFSSNRPSYNDGHGHGTHVAGTIAARKNGTGVVGVAPGAGLYAVKVLGDSGTGSDSAVIAGIDWVAAHGPGTAANIRVANMSLGHIGGNDAMLQALDGAVANGIVFALAAGNYAIDCGQFVPASSRSPGVITVSALADSDGKSGGTGSATGSGPDDWIAGFSDNGRNEPDDLDNPDATRGNGVDLIAPGVSIYSTYKNKSYATMSGTSMASPHVAGVAALFIAGHADAEPAEVKLALLQPPGGWASHQYFDGLYYVYGLLPWRALDGDYDSGYPNYLDETGYEPLVNAGFFASSLVP